MPHHPHSPRRPGNSFPGFLAALLVLALLSPADAQRSTVIALSPASFNGLTDAAGMTWDIQPGGYIDNGSNWAFNNAMVLQVNNSGFSPQNQQMTPDGKMYVFSGQVGQLTVERRVIANEDGPGCLWVDSYTNNTNAAQTASILYHINLRRQAQNVVTDSGAQVSGQIPEGQSGFVIQQQQGSGSPSVAALLAHPKSKVRPAVNNNSNYQFQITYSLSIPAGKTQSLAMSLGQFNTLGSSSKEIEQAFDAMSGRKYLRNIPVDIRRTIVNWKTSLYSAGERPPLWTLAEDLGVEPEAQDLLAIGEGTRLRGVVAADSLSVQTLYGSRDIPIDRVAAIAGPKFRAGQSQVYLRDGQVLVGQLSAEGLRFQMTSGPTVALDPDKLDRLVLREQPGDGTPAPEVSALLETFTGDRLAVNHDSELRLTAVTPWGTRAFQLDELKWVRNVTGSVAGYEIILNDGSKLLAQLDGGSFQANLSLFGPQTLNTTQLRFLTADLLPPDENAAQGVARPHVVLAGGQVIVGPVDLPELNLQTVSGLIPVAPDQAKVIRNLTEEDPTLPGRGIPFTVELWSGGNIVGRMSNDSLPVRSGGSQWRVPARDVVEIVRPTPTVTRELRSRILLLIRDLGSPEWPVREAATAELRTIGAPAAPSLREVSNQSTDPEVRKRAEELLKEIED